MPKLSTADILAPDFTYSWANKEKTLLHRNEGFQEDSPFEAVYVFPATEGNKEYESFLASGATAADYVAPPEPPEPTTEEKVDHLLSDYGLTREEMLAALTAK